MPAVRRVGLCYLFCVGAGLACAATGSTTFDGTIDGNIAHVTATYRFIGDADGLEPIRLRVPAGAAVQSLRSSQEGAPARLAAPDAESFAKQFRMSPAREDGFKLVNAIVRQRRGAETRVDLEYTLLLPFEDGAYRLTLPLRPNAEAGAPAEVDLDLRVEIGYPIETIETRPTASVRRDGQSAATVRYTGDARDETFELALRPATAQADWSSVRASWFEEPEGYLLYEARPNEDWDRPRIELSGDGLEAFRWLEPSRTTRAGQSVTMLGRYRGGGEATLRVLDADGNVVREETVELPDRNAKATERPLESLLWAARNIDLWYDQDEVAGSEANRDRIVRLSRDYDLYNPYGYYLAVAGEAETDAVSLEDADVVYYRRVEYRQAEAEAEAEVETQRARVTPRRLVPGDPLVQVEAPAEAASVVALLPGGDVLPLRYDSGKGLWRGRFEIPQGTPEGLYRVRILIALPDGQRQTLTVGYTVDTTAPSAAPAGELIARRGQPFTVEVTPDDGAVRAILALPWGRRIELTREGPGQPFRATFPIPATAALGSQQVRCIVMDAVHNRTVVSMEIQTVE